MRVIFQNPDDKNQFEKLHLLKPEQGILIKGSGVPLDAFVPLSEPQENIPVILLPARLLWDKGVGEFIEAAKLLKNRIDVRMVLAGPIDLGNPSAIPEAKIKEWVDQGWIEYWGFQSCIQSAFKASHIVCLPSYREGLPRVLIEAAACERPIITTNVPGCRDIVIHERNGLLVEVRNPTQLADAIAELSTNPEKRQTMGKIGREMVASDFSATKVNQLTLSVYRNLLPNT